MNITGFEQRLYEHAARLKENMADPFDNEMEDLIMQKAAENKKIIHYKKVMAVVAVAACFLLGSTAFASGVLSGWFSYSEKEYSELPSEQEYIADVGYAPVLIQEFENGYSYKTGYAVNNDRADGETAVVESFMSGMFEYEKDRNTVSFWQEKYEGNQAYGTKIDSFAGVDLYYSSYMNKLVPADYQMTEADKEAQDKGELVFSWGSDRVQTMEVKSVQWIKDGIHFMLLQTGGELGAEELCAMAKEALAK